MLRKIALGGAVAAIVLAAVIFFIGLPIDGPGPVPPHPDPGPGPLKDFAKRLVDRLLADVAPPRAREADRLLLVQIYEEMGAATGDFKYTSNADLLAELRRISGLRLAPASLVDTRKEIAAYLAEQLGTEPGAPFDRAKARAAFKSVADALGSVRVAFMLDDEARQAEPPPEPQHRFGWTPDAEAVKAIVEQLPFKHFADTPAGQAGDLPRTIYLWDAYRQMFARPPPAKNQGNIGSCVSFGTNNAVARSLIVDIVLFKANYDYKDIAEEVTYGGSRVQVGGGRLRGDGSVGAWAAKFVQGWGVVAREKQGDVDLSTYSVQRCRDYGAKGVPAALQTVAKQTPVKTITQVLSWDMAKKSLASGYAISVCSNQGFTMRRDAKGVCYPSGSWPHCMCLDGYYVDEDGKEYGHIENSWGADAMTGPVGWGAPSTAGFWAQSKVVDRMLKAGDSWAFSAVTGFPARKIDWFAGRDRLPPLDATAAARRLDPWARSKN